MCQETVTLTKQHKKGFGYVAVTMVKTVIGAIEAVFPVQREFT
jgi:hypothetical protein